VWFKEKCEEIGGPSFFDLIIYTLMILVSMLVLFGVELYSSPKTAETLAIIVCALFSLLMFGITAVDILKEDEVSLVKEEEQISATVINITDVKKRPRTGSAHITKKA
jgi:hypothetical protein